MSTRAALGIWTLALACAAGATLLVATSDHTSGKLATILLAVPAMLVFVASGILARVQRPQNRTGWLLILVGFAWALGALGAAGNDVVFTAGLALNTIFTALLAHLLLAFPTGRLVTRVDRWIATAFYAVAVIAPPVALLFDAGDIVGSSCDGPCPDNLLSAFPHQTLANAVLLVYAVTATSLAVGVLIRLVQRWRGASPALRRALLPVFVTAAVLIGLAVLQTVVGLAVSESAAEAINWFVLGAVLAVPVSFLYGLTRTRFSATTRRLVAELSEKREPEEVQEVLRAALRDPALELGYVAKTHGGYVDVHGRPLRLPDEGEGRMATRIGDEVLVHDAALADQPELEAVIDATHIALERGLSLRSLEASERRATALLDAIPDSMYRISRDGTFLEFRLSETSQLPVPADELIGMTIADILRPDSVEEVSAAIGRALDLGTTEVVEYTLEQPEQREVEPLRHLEARLVRSGAEEIVAIVRDITTRKRQAEALESLVDEQAALSRVALAVATETKPEILFDIVTEELGRLLGADAANLVRFAPDSIEGLIVGKWSEPGIAIGEPGRTVTMDGGPLSRVHRTGQPARGKVDDPDIGPRLRKRLIELGVTSVVAAPIEVSGELWGSIVVSVTHDKSFPEGAEERIEKFAALVSVALANAETLEALESLAAEQAAVSRVALAVATETGPETLFDIVAEELGRLLGADAANLVRFVPERDEGVVVGQWSESDVAIGEPGRTVLMDGGPLTRVRRTGLPTRGGTDDPDITPRLREAMIERGVTSVVAGPVELGGEQWGSIVVAVTGDNVFPDGAENRIAQFASLVAVALANAQAREELALLAEEQAALSRVAVAVATEEQRERLFNIATEEIGRLFGARAAAIVRFLDDPNEAELVGGWEPHSESPVEIGARLPYRGGAVTVVRRTGRAARIDLEHTPDDVRREMEAGGVTSGVAAPIVVSGRPWGATLISIAASDRFQPDAEERLEKFTRLVAVALANAEAREQITGLATEQAALRRVAVAAATEAPERLFDVVTEETARFFGAKRGSLVRYLDQDHVEVVGIWQADSEHERRVGERFTLLGGAITRVKETGRPARLDHDYDQDGTPRQMVAAPIVVAGELWGAASISSPLPHTFHPDVEERLEKFTGLVAVALANAQAHRSLATLAEEHSALSRVAVAVATQESPDRLFNVVSEEVGRLLGARSAATVRYVPGKDESVIVGGWALDERFPVDVGARLPFQGGAIERVARTGQPARVDLEKERPSVRQTMRSTDVSSHVAAPIVVTGQLWGATSVSIGPPDRFPPDSEERLGKFTGLVALALANAEARKQLTASRARIVQAGDAARRRLERNLHDGAQQRLVTLSLTLRLAQARLHDDPAAAQELLEASSEELASALEELRELARGLHPAILTDRGLEAALEALATRTPVPVELDHVPAGRLPPPVEAAAYYVVAESLTNVAKYADASSARVKVEQHDGYAIVEVEDDGVGGVDITGGSGLRGLADRVEALDGRLIVSSEAGRGTRVRAEIPCS